MRLYKLLVVGVLMVSTLSVGADQVLVPFTFENGNTADADEINSNFDALEIGINGNVARISSIESVLVSGANALGPVPDECGQGAFGYRAGVPLFPDGNVFYNRLPKSFEGIPTSNSHAAYRIDQVIFYSLDPAGLTISARTPITSSLRVIGHEFPDLATLEACFYGLLEVGRL